MQGTRLKYKNDLLHFVVCGNSGSGKSSPGQRIEEEWPRISASRVHTMFARRCRTSGCMLLFLGAGIRPCTNRPTRAVIAKLFKPTPVHNFVLPHEPSPIRLLFK